MELKVINTPHVVQNEAPTMVVTFNNNNVFNFKMSNKMSGITSLQQIKDTMS